MEEKSRSQLLTIRSTQYDAFVDLKVNLFKTRVFKYLRKYFEEQTAQFNDNDLFKIINNGTKKADLYGFIYEAHIVKIIEFMILICDDFDVSQETGWAHPILTNKHLNPNEKIQFINESYLKFSKGEKQCNTL
ncbi:hypothetical protein MHK_002495 [Candidatus Magnetomorum sp. HK-1]|nr:hypothetical protein MHK_002495 [Candidatus Magnetomorum sp. HK-1]